MVLHLSSSTMKAEAGGLLGDSGQPRLQSEAHLLVESLLWYPEPHEPRCGDACL